MKKVIFSIFLSLSLVILLAVGYSYWIITTSITNIKSNFKGLQNELQFDYENIYTYNNSIQYPQKSLDGYTLSYKYKYDEDSSWNSISSTDGPVDVGTYDLHVTATNNNNANDKLYSQVKIIIEPLKLKAEYVNISYGDVLSSNSRKASAFVDFIYPSQENSLVVLKDEGGTIHKIALDLNSLTMTNGINTYDFTESQNVVGSTYLLNFKPHSNNYLIYNYKTSNYEETGNTVLKYKTAIIGYGSTTYYTIEDAIKNSGSTMITLPGLASNTDYVMTSFTALSPDITGYNSTDYYTLKTKLRIPFADVDMDYHGSGGLTNVSGETNQCDTIAVTAVDSVFSALYIPSNVSLEVTTNGILNIGGLIDSGSAVINRGIVINDGTINCNGAINSYGYLKGKGRVNLIKGTIIDVFKIFDWQGGKLSSGLNSASILPVNAFSVHNVSCETKVYAGASYDAFWSIKFNNTLYKGYQRGDKNGNVKIIGSNGLFNLSSGYIVKSASESKKTNTATNLSSVTGSNQVKGQKDIVSIYGQCSDNSISLTISASGTSFDMKTNTNLAASIPYMDITIGDDKAGNVGNLTLSASSYKVMPGSSIKVEKNANLTVSKDAKLLLYEIDNAIFDEAKRGSSFITKTGGHCVDRIDATLTVDGTLTISEGAYIGGKILTSNSTGIFNLNGYSYSPSIYVVSSKEGFLGLTQDYTTSTKNYPAKIYLYNSTGNYKLAYAVDGSLYQAKDGAWYTEYVNIVLNPNGGTLTGSVTELGPYPTGSGFTISSSILNTISNPTRNYYTFGGWYIDAECTTKAEGQVIFADSYIFAKWIPNNYSITFVDKYYNDFTTGQQTYDTFTFNAANSIELPTNITNGPSNAPYVFGGWFLDEACTKRVYLTGDIDLENYLINNKVTLYGLWYPNGTQKYIINYSNDNADVSYQESVSFIIANENSWNNVTIQMLTEKDNVVDYGQYFGGWVVGETTITSSSFFNSSNASQYFKEDENGNMVCTLTAVWLEKVQLTVKKKISTNDPIQIVQLYYKPGYSYNLSSINLDLESMTVLTGWEYKTSSSNSTLTYSYNQGNITLTDTYEITAIIKKVVLVTVSTITNSRNFTSYSLYVSQTCVVNNGICSINGEVTKDKPDEGTEIYAVEGATITAKGTGGSYWAFGTHYYEVDITIDSVTKSGGNAIEVSNTTIVGSTDISVSFTASSY